jgi:hypothetical protein
MDPAVAMLCRICQREMLKQRAGRGRQPLRWPVEASPIVTVRSLRRGTLRAFRDGQITDDHHLSHPV